MKYSVFHVEGGLGKNVAATAVAQAIKNNYPNRQLIVVCSYPEVFWHLPFVYRSYRIGVTPYFYQEYLEDKDTELFKHEPYFTTAHIYKRKSLIENWCELHNLKYDNEQPVLNISKRIKDIVKIKFGNPNNPKPIMLLQTHGGLLQGQNLPYAWTRDMPKELIQKVVNQFSPKYRILQICRSEFNVAINAEGVIQPMSNLELFALLHLSEKRLFIDSCMQHAAAALGMESVVLWIGSPSKVFGYEMHKNIQALPPKNKLKLPDSYLFDYNFEGNIHEYPYEDMESIFDVEEVIKALE